MDDKTYDRFEEYVRDGWDPHHGTKAYVCGWCGRSVSTSTGLYKHEEWMSIDSIGPFLPNRRTTDIRVCPECWVGTTFLDEKLQLPAAVNGDNLDPSDKGEEVEMIVSLYNEARVALSRRAPSCAVLMFRKLLMHIAVHQGAKIGLKFVQYVDYFKDENVVGKPQHEILDRIKDAGNIENHQIVRATPEQAEDLLDLATLLIRSVYFSS